MIDLAVVRTIQRYLDLLPEEGIHAHCAILFGPFARGAEEATSDIDLVVIAPEFDEPHQIDRVKDLRRVAAEVDDRIESIPCGEREWSAGGGRRILGVARREGVKITV